jgi:hypothetical protein
MATGNGLLLRTDLLFGERIGATKDGGIPLRAALKQLGTAKV